MGSISVSIIGTEEFLIGLNEVLKKHLNISGGITKLKKTEVVQQLFLKNIKDTKKFLDFIYQNATIYLDRKYERYLLFNMKYDEYINKEYLKSIKHT